MSVTSSDTQLSTTRSRRGMIGLLVANTFSLSGTRLSQIALPWFVITTTGSATQTGIAAFALMAPYVVAKALGGPIIDRLGPRRVIITTELAASAIVATIPLLNMLGLLHFGVLLGVVVLLGAVTGPADGAKGALIPVVAEAARVPFERVTGLYGMIERLATTVGAGVAGALVALIGPVSALWINGATFAIAALLIAATAPRPTTSPNAGYLNQLREGLGFIRQERLLRSIYAMVAATNLLDAAAFQVLLPVWAHDTGAGPAAIGLLAAAMGGAAVVSSALAAAIGHRMPRRMTYLVGFMIAGLPRFAILALDVPLPLIAAVFAISGFGSGFLNPILGAVIFERIPRELVGRVTTMGSSLAWAGIPFGGLVGGGLITATALAPALVICGLAYFVVTTIPGLQREWKEMDTQRHRAAPVTSGENPESADADRAAAV
jgi:MFS family permease